MSQKKVSIIVRTALVSLYYFQGLQGCMEKVSLYRGSTYAVYKTVMFGITTQQPHSVYDCMKHLNETEPYYVNAVVCRALLQHSVHHY